AVTPRTLVGGPSLTKASLVLGGGLLLLLVAGTVALALGSVGVGLGDTAAILGHRLLGVPAQVTWSAPAEQIIMEVRLPRVLTAMLVGGGLSVAGATFQAVLRNPRADPYIIGTASGASLGAIAAPTPPGLPPGPAGRAASSSLRVGTVQVLGFSGGPRSVRVVSP